MIESIYPYLILAGLTIGAVLVYLSLQARRNNNLHLELTRLNEQLQFDTPNFLQHAWPILSEGGLRGFRWKLNWFGVISDGAHGSVEGELIEREIQVAELNLSISFLPSKHGERRYFETTLIETFLLLLRTDMWIKIGAVNATVLQLSKLTLFLQHDMKNVAQFIQLMSDQVQSCQPGQEKRVLDYLKTAAPLMRDRADRIVATLTLGRPNTAQKHSLQLAEELTKICALHRLECRIDGNATVNVPEQTLDIALDNILKNYGEVGLRNNTTPQMLIRIAAAQEEVQIRIEASNLEAPAEVDRLFEPFWSSQPQGLGIGLYQAKQLVESCGGSLSVTITDGGRLEFVVKVATN